MQPVINVCTPGSPDPADSYGLLACRLATGLAQLGVYVNLLSLGPRDVPFQSAELRAIIEQPIRASLGGIMLGYSTTFKQHTGLTQLGPKVGITMFKSSKIPPIFVPELQQVAAIVTPSHFCKTVFEEAGVTVPIHVVPLGVNPLYQPAERSTDGPLTFLAFIDRGLRKGGPLALKAFQAAFGDDMNYRLILKGRKSKVNATILNPNVTLIQEDYSEAQLYELYKQCHVLINPHRGEGFGLLPREASSSGMTVLTTAWSGTADDLDKWGLGIDYTLVKADWAGHNQFSKMDLGQWAEVNFADLVDKIEGIADNRLFYQQRADRQAPNVQALYSWETFAQKVLNIWEGVQ
jgi:glycosyltransferase involved in cell wall biosynthesis